MDNTHHHRKSNFCHLSSGGHERLPDVDSPLVPHTPRVRPQLEPGGCAAGPGGGVLHKQQSSTEKVNYWC